MATYLLVSLLFIAIPTPFLNSKFIFTSSKNYVHTYVFIVIFIIRVVNKPVPGSGIAYML